MFNPPPPELLPTCWLVVPVMTVGVPVLPFSVMITIGLDGMPPPMTTAEADAVPDIG